MRSKIRYFVLAFIFLLAIGLYARLDYNPKIYDQSDTYVPRVSSTIPYSSEFNFRQTVNGCGPFSAAAVVRALTDREIDSKEFDKSMRWRLRDGGTLPMGMEKQLKEHGISVEIPEVSRLTDEQKISLLQENLSQNKPIIVLGQTKDYEHYITLFGFDTSKDEFYIYDSFHDKEKEGYTKDDNGDLPGNRTFTSKELLDFWRGGGMYGFYNWYAIVASSG